jgi:imidazolonepropionase-like amidohydrolase
VFGILLPVLIGMMASPGGADPDEVTAIVHGTVVPMDAERELAAHTILVRDGRIAWIGPDSLADVPPGARIIDAGGSWVVPGLADMHVHAGEEDLPVFVANGVTTVREMNGTPAHLALRAEIREGRRAGPSLIVTGPLLAGEEQPWRHVVVRTPDEGRALVGNQAEAGYDAIKIYDGLSRETYDVIAAAADSAGIPFVGHVPRAVGLERVLEAGQRSIEHVNQIAETLRSADSVVLAEVAAGIARTGAWVTPTLASVEALSRRGTPWYEERLAMREVGLVDPGLVEWWRSLGAEAPDSAHQARRGASVEDTRALVRALRDADVPLLAGTDTPNPLMVPGFALHEELAALVAAGLSPYEALRAATAEAARFAGATEEFGTIREGSRADLVVVAGDPLSDVAALRRPVGVMVRGEWFPRESLEALISEALSSEP